MLIGFSCENFRSFRDEQSLSMLAGPTKNLNNQVMNVKGFDILKSALIFGANGAGKSNLFKAIRLSSQIIIKNRPDYGYHDAFQTECDKSKPTTFQYEIEINGEFFRYGFSLMLDKKEVVGEWLYEIFPDAGDRQIFYRYSDNTVEFEDEKKPFEEINGTLFIHNARRKDFWYGKENKDREKIYLVQKWFWESLAVIGPDASLLWDLEMNENDIKGITDVVKCFDTGIVGSGFCTYALGDEPVDIVDNPRVKKDSQVKKGNKGIFRQGKDGRLEAFRFKHGAASEFFVNLNEESDGTLRIMKLSPILFRDDKDCTYIIDEFDRTLHPMVVRGFLKWFLKKQYSSHKQFIMTTHNAHLLDQELIRRDEIWFVQKDEEGATSLYSLDDYKVRFDKDIEKAYLEGHFRGMPDVILPEDVDDGF